MYIVSASRRYGAPCATHARRTVSCTGIIFSYPRQYTPVIMADDQRFDVMRDLALLYLIMAHGTDDYLSDTELTVITDRLHARTPGDDRADVQDVVMEALAVYMDAQEPMKPFTAAMYSLREQLEPAERHEMLNDLADIARADGVVLKNERGLLRALAECWEVERPGQNIAQPLSKGDRPPRSIGVMLDLAYIYLTLAHGTDYELSEAETQVMLRKLNEWQPSLSEGQVRDVLREAMERYAEGLDERRLQDAIEAVKEGLPKKQRMAALNDLIQIANADGVFLDGEEDLINRLLAVWEVDPYANYGDHGSKE